jgi:hypothetical protein
VSGGQTRLDDLHVSVAACLTAQALNIGYAPVAKKGVPALEPDRLAHVSRAYLSAETFSLANAPLIDAQAGIPFAQALGGGMAPPSTGCGSSSRSLASTPAPTASTSDPNGA